VRRIIPLALVVLLAACSGGTGTAGISTSTAATGFSTSSTTDPGEECRRLAEDAYEYLVGVVEELAGVDPEQLSDRAQWPQALLDLEERGEALDRRAAEEGCDRGALQQAVLARASNLQATGLGMLLLDLLLGRLG